MHLFMPNFERARILVVGDVMLDRYWHGMSNRISPEAPVPVVKVDQTEDRPGGGANVALNMAALGANVSLVGVVGNDKEGQVLEGFIRAAGIDTHLLVSSTKPTITKLRVVSRHQQLLRMDFEEKFDASDSLGLANKVKGLLPQANVLILSDYAKGSLQDCQSIIRMAREMGVPVLVDPKGQDFSRYCG